MQLVAGTTTIDLPDDLQWTDEYAWSPVEQAEEYAVTGALVVDVAARQAGRPITYEGSDTVWVSRATVAALRSLAAVPGQEMVLTNAESGVFNVIFNHRAGAIEARPVLFSAPLDAADQYVITLRFLEI